VIGIVVTKRSTGEGIGWATAASEVETVLAGAPSDAAGPGTARSDNSSAISAMPDQSAWPVWMLPVILLGVVVLGLVVVHLPSARRRRTRRATVEVLDPLDLTDEPELNAGKAPTWTP
jgi:hypothetical protein